MDALYETHRRVNSISMPNGIHGEELRKYVIENSMLTDENVDEFVTTVNH